MPIRTRDASTVCDQGRRYGYRHWILPVVPVRPAVFLGPGASETFYHLHSRTLFYHCRQTYDQIWRRVSLQHNVQDFDGFALGRYIFAARAASCTTATPASAGNGYGRTHCHVRTAPTLSTTSCPEGTTVPVRFSSTCRMHLRRQPDVQQAGYSNSHHEPAIYDQDTWSIVGLTLNYVCAGRRSSFPIR